MTERISDFFGSMRSGSHRNLSLPELQGMQAQAQNLEQRAAQADQLEQQARLTISEPDIYAPGSSHSWFADVGRVVTGEASGKSGGVKGAADRIAAHERYEHKRIDVQLRRAQAEHALEEALTRTPAEAALYSRWLKAGGHLFDKFDEIATWERRSGADRTTGSGGYFAPPGFLIDEWIHSPRAGAPLAGLMQHLLIPPGVQNIQVPQFATGGGIGTGVQTADAGGVPYRDPHEGILKANLETLAVNLDVSMQLLDQTPIPFDDTFGQDITEDFAMQLNGQLLLGDGTYGQVNGVIPGGTFSASNLLLLQSTLSVSDQTWASNGSSFQGSAHQMTSQLYAKVARARGLPPTHWVVNPDVWAIIAGSCDGQNRPLVEPGREGKFLHGLPVIEDENIDSSFGGSIAPSIGVSAGVISPTAGNGTYAPVLLGRWADCLYFTSEPKVKVMPQALAGTLQVRYQVTQFIASMPGRIVWGGTNVTYSGEDQAGGLNTGAACAYGAFTQFESNSPLSPSSLGY